MDDPIEDIEESERNESDDDEGSDADYEMVPRSRHVKEAASSSRGAGGGDDGDDQGGDDEEEDDSGEDEEEDGDDNHPGPIPIIRIPYYPSHRGPIYYSQAGMADTVTRMRRVNPYGSPKIASEYTLQEKR